MRSEFLTKIKEIASQLQDTNKKLNAKTRLQGCVELPANKQSKTSLGKGKNGGRNYNSPRGRFSKPTNKSLGS